MANPIVTFEMQDGGKIVAELYPDIAPQSVYNFIALANASEYGLGGAVWTRDINRALRVARGVNTGRMWVNTYNSIPAGAPFGGYKESGIGRETHKMMLDHYQQTKNLLVSYSENKLGFF